MGDSLRSGTEDKLIAVSKAYHKAIGDRDASGLEKLLAPRVTLYADRVTLRDDINGRKDVVTYFQLFFDRYDYTRGESYGAVDQEHSVAFSIVTDKGVLPKKGNREQPSSVISLTMLEISDGVIHSIYIARQLPYDEAERKLKHIPDYKGSSFNAEDLGNDNIKPSHERAQQHQKAAELWNQIFVDNDPARAEEISDPNIKVHALLTSQQTTGLEAWKNSLKDIFKDWECKNNEHKIAVTPGNKAFIFWRTSGVYKDEFTTVWGLNILLFNDAGKIQEVASLYQPFPGMRESLLKGY